jgi:asparagine synthase (glutamine-hydrolysing)
MCRLFGNIALNSKKLDSTDFKNLTLLSKRGGPDSTEFYEDDFVQFGFNRLAILDTSEQGNQPFISDSGRWVLMLNGEIYNYRDLTRQFQIQGLKSGSDAEVVLKLIEKIGFEKTVKELNGMFAIACWDNVEQQLFLARDFAGVKPLFYSNSTHGFIFGSQFNQLLKHPWIHNWSWSAVGLTEYLQFGYMPAPNTIANEVFQLGVGQYLKYSLKSKSLIIENYQQFFSGSGNDSELDEKANSTIGQIITSAVKHQLVSDVPLGVFLSGGVDSTLVAAKARELNPDITAVTIGFEDAKYDESEKSKAYAKHLNIKNHHVEKFSGKGMLDIIDDHFADMPEPIADYSSLPTYLVSRIASKVNKVMLSGDGGDELFWGYPRFLTFSNSAKYFNLPGSTNRKLVKKILKHAGCNITGFLGEENLGAANMAFQSYITPESILRYTGSYQISEETKNGYAFSETDRRNSLDYLRKNEFYFHLQKILVKVDRMSMANSLEVRVPLLDKEVIQAAEKFHSELGGGHQVLKHVLKQEFYKHVPKSLVEQQKKGFTPPLINWVENELRNEIELELKDCDFLKHDLISDYYKSKTISLEHLWTVYVLVVWLKLNKN